MKKLFITWGFVAAALTLFSCAKQETIVKDAQPTQAGVPFELVAGVDTKTEATDAGVVTWKEGDALNVFHAAAETTSYSNNDKFTFSSGSSFTGTLQDGELTENAYDWYALYPYYSGIETPSNTSKGYTTFAASQTQVGNNSMAHLCGENMPLYGKVTNVAKDAKPSITMNQAASIIKVHVTNALEDDLTVTSVAFTAPVNIVGNYFINFAGEQPSFTETGTPKKTVSLSVTGGAPIAKKDGTADFYIVVKPFETAANDEITVSVNGLEKTIKLASAVTFAPGKIKTVNFAYDEAVSMFMWDLTTNSYSAASASQVTWNHEKAQMVADKASASTASNNYLGGDANNRTSSRFYTDSKLTITPSAGVLILKVEAEATSESYANTLKNSSWTNASAEVDGTKVTITPTNGAIAFYATIGGVVGLTGVSVIYSELAQKNVASIAVTTPPTKIDYKVGETLDMSGAVITATYDDATTDDVTDFVTTDAAEVLAHAGDAKPVTVTFEGKNATFNVNVAKGDADLAYAKTDYKATINSAFATPTLTNPHNLTVTYSSSDEDLVLVDENTGDVVIGSTTGAVTITASTAGNADYNAGSATYTITVKEPSEVAGTWASFPCTTAFAPSNNTVYSKVSSDFCGTSATLEAYNSSNTKQSLTNYSGNFSAVYFNANIGSYWKVSLPVSKAIPEGTKITLSCYIAVNAKVYNNWQVSYNGTACGNAVNVIHNGAPSKLGDMTKVEGSYTTTADIAKDSVIEFRITAAKGDGTKAGNNRITQIIVTAE